MATTRISAQLPPHIDQTKSSLAYGNRMLPKLNRELSGLELITKQRALVSLCEVMHKPENIAESVRVGVVESLKDLLGDEDQTVRIKTTQVLYILSTHAIGREAFLSCNVILPLSKLFDDDVIDVRVNVHSTLEKLSSDPMGARAILTADLVPTLVEKVKSEDDEIKELILTSLHYCMMIDPGPCLATAAMATFTDLLSHALPPIRSKAALAIQDLSFPLAGKKQACQSGCVPTLASLLEDVSPGVRACAAGALMTISITTEGKFLCLKAGVIPRAVSLLSDPNNDVKINAIKVITTLAESPQGRKELSESLPKLDPLCNHGNETISKAASIAINVIQWKP
ncbi:radial spoke head 14 homolog [Oscarella lobularis]|uniref:radial spoke head 14 homolog n=1 Tax=Oscarella lobularis TaxID=121494 RepID=UPI0033135103